MPKACAKGKTSSIPLSLQRFKQSVVGFDSEDPELGAVLLIGVNEAEPLTVLDGNHRLMAAMLQSPGATRKASIHTVGYLRA